MASQEKWSIVPVSTLTSVAQRLFLAAAMSTPGVQVAEAFSGRLPSIMFSIDPEESMRSRTLGVGGLTSTCAFALCDADASAPAAPASAVERNLRRRTL